MYKQFWTTHELLAAGNSANDLTEAVRSGVLIRPRRGYYAVPDAPPDLVRSIRVGGPATSTTAGPHHGIWTPPDTMTHVAVARKASRLRSAADREVPLTEDGAGVCIHRDEDSSAIGTRLELVTPLRMLQHAFECLRPEYALAMLESALHERLIKPNELALLASAVPAAKRSVVLLADGRSESGLETIVRYLLFLAGIVADVQVLIPGVGRVDLLIAGWLIIELDGRAFHTGADAFVRDRQRDADAAERRYRTLRFTYSQVMHDWPAVLRAIRGALAA